MKWLLKILVWIGIDKILGKLIRGVLSSLLYELAERVKDEDIEKLKEQVEDMIEARLHGLPKELAGMIKESLRPAIFVFFEILKYTDDAAKAVAEALKTLS